MKIGSMLRDEEKNVVITAKCCAPDGERWYWIHTRDGREGIVPEYMLDDNEQEPPYS